MEKIALLPGGFKPPHAGHYNMAKWLANNTDANTVIVKVGAKERDGITRDMSLKLWDLYRSTDSDPAANKLSIIPSKHNSPVKDVYDFIEQEAPENSTIYLGMGEKEMKTNDQRFANIGKFADPKGINFETKLVPPQAGGVSGTDMRGFIMDKDQYSFFDYIPKHLTPEQKEQAWQIVTTVETSEWKPGDPVTFEMWTSDWNLKGFGKEYNDNIVNREAAIAYYKPNKAEEWAFKSYAYVAKKIQGFGEELEEDIFSEEWWTEELKEISSDNQATINGQLVPLEIMTSPEEQMRGMMGRDDLDGGMLFPYGEAEPRSFHMKNCLIPLDIVFIVEGEIYNIKPNCPPCSEEQCPQYTGLADNVLELPGGYCQQNNINVGDYIKFPTNSSYEVGYHDYAKSNDPGPKKPVEPAYKYKRRNFPFRSMYEDINEDWQTQSGKKKLRVFDFDDTIAETNSKIKIQHSNGEIEILNSEEYAKYQGQPGDKFDFSDFDKVIRDATPIQNIINLLKNDLKDPTNKVTVLTARMLAYPVRRYLKTLGLDAYVVAVGGVEPELKANWIADHIENKGYDDIVFIDDSEPNRIAIKALRNEYPGAKIEVFDPSSLNEMMGTMTNQEKAKHKKKLKQVNNFTDKINKSNQYVELPKSITQNRTLTRKLYELEDREIRFFALHADILKQLNTPNFNLKYQELSQKLEGERLEALEYFYNEYLSKLNDNCEIDEIKYGVHDLITQHKDKIQSDYGHQQYRDLQLMLTQNKNEKVETWLKSKGYINEHTVTFTKDDMAKLHKDGELVKADEDGKEHTYVFDELDEYYVDIIDENEEYCPICTAKNKLEEKKGKCTPSKGKRFAKRVNGKCRSYGQAGKAKKGGDRIRPGTKKGDAYCARSAKIKKCKNPPCANALSRKKWKCQGSKSVAESRLFSKEWWSNIINEHIITEGGAAGHMAHPFDLSNVNSGKDLKNIFEKAANSLQSNPGSVKIDGVNSSIRLVTIDGVKQFVMDRGSKKELDIKGITKDNLLNRFGKGHGMVKIGGEVLDLFNSALPNIENNLKELGAWEDPNILFNMEYVSGKTNVQDYGSNFVAIHGLNKIESKEVQGKRKMLTKRISSEISYNKETLQSLLDNLKPVAKERGFEVYGSVPTKMGKKPNFNSALSKQYTVEFTDENKTQSLDKWLDEINVIPKDEFIFINTDNTPKKVGAVSKQVYQVILNRENVDDLFDNEEDREKAINGFVTYLATEKLGDEVLKVLDSPMGSVENHEGVVIRDEKIANVPFKITGKFILGGIVSDFKK